MRSLHWVFVVCVFAAAACGPGELPAFADPPPEPDAGIAKDASHDDHDDHDEDAGTSNHESS